MISVSCSGCQKAYRLEDRLAGKTVRCKSCGQTFIAPNPDVDLDEIFPTMEEVEPAPASVKAEVASRRPKNTSSVAPPSPESAPHPTTFETDFDIGNDHDESDSFDFEPESEAVEAPEDADPDADYGAFESDGVTVGQSHVPRKKESKKKRPKKPPGIQARLSSMVTDEPGKTIVWGSMAGMLGAICWGAIAYYANREISFVAWVIGWIVGSAVRITSDDLDDRTAGMIATLIAIGSIVCGKLFAAIAMELDAGIGNFDWTLVGTGFLATFGALDSLFFVLAVCMAYYVASRHDGD